MGAHALAEARAGSRRVVVPARERAAVVVQGAPERVLARRTLVELSLRMTRARWTRRSRATGRAADLGQRVVARLADLERVGGVQVHARDLGGVEPHQTRVGVDHVTGVAARRHAREILRLDGAEDVGADPQPSGRGAHFHSFMLARFLQDSAEGQLRCHVITPRMRRWTRRP